MFNSVIRSGAGFFVRSKALFAGAVALTTGLGCQVLLGSENVAVDPESQWLLHYAEPAGEWTEALPIGNGHMGAMVFGRVEEERIQFNEDTLWTGQPHDYQPEEKPVEVLSELRQLLFDGKQNDAHGLAMRRFMSVPLRQCAYQPFGDLELAFDGHGEATEYRRWLDLDSAMAGVEYTVDGARFTREVFASYPDRVIVVKLSTDEPGGLDFRAGLSSPHVESEQLAGGADELILRGRVTNRARRYDLESVMEFESRLQIRTEGGSVDTTEEGTVVTGADSAVIVLAAGTNYINYSDLSADPGERCARILAAVKEVPYETLRRRHTGDHRELFRRVDIDLGRTEAAKKSTDERIEGFAEGDDPHLIALKFQFGRYLLIASSRPGSQPANLQGVWNESLNPPWESKYTVNINIEMNYWPAELTNLSECHDPLFEMLKDVSETGAITARNFYEADGWVLHHNTDLWRGTAPINHANHGVWVTGGAWFCQHLWWRYEYTLDKEFLRDTAYPLMKGAAEFFMDYLIEDPRSDEGWLISGPSNSPEIGGLVMGPTMDHQIVRALFENTAKAAEILGVDADFRETLMAKHARIAPNQIGQHGQLQEWLEDRDNPNERHRHVSHLWGLHPGREITREGAPKLFDAARTSLEFRGDGGTGWSMAWKINFWARFYEGDRAFGMIRRMLHPNRTLPNMFSLHPPFQIDANFGAVSGVAELLMQSHAGYIDLLPALPALLPDGHIEGLRARGGFEVDVVWREGALERAEITSVGGTDAELRYNGEAIAIELDEGESIMLTAHSFAAE